MNEKAALGNGEPNLKRKRPQHPYLKGNFYPVSKEHELVPAKVVGVIPRELGGGQYIRNGGNARFPAQDGQPYHWFDADGMLHGILFPINENGQVEARYVNKFVKTDVFYASEKWKMTLLPSITSLIDSTSSKVAILQSIMGAGVLKVLSGTARLSVANTALLFHDKRLLATCESGPPVHVHAPSLDTVDFHTFKDDKGQSLGRKGSPDEWTTAHPKIDPINGDLIFFGYNIFSKPYASYSVIDRDGKHLTWKQPIHLSQPKMMHDFACSRTHSIIMDLPLTMDPFNIVRAGKPMLSFDKSMKSRFGIIPRLYSGKKTEVQWFETDGCMIFHTANAWDETKDDQVVAINLLACRFRTGKLAYRVGNLSPPPDLDDGIEDVVRLFYYRFDLTSGIVTHAFPLHEMPFEFPILNSTRLMREARYVYGCSMREGSFDEALSSAKIDALVKVDVKTILASSKPGRNAPALELSMSATTRLFLPHLHFASEPCFVPRTNPTSEDDGYLLSLIYNESGFDEQGNAPEDDDDQVLQSAASQLWIFDAKSMNSEPIARIILPARVPYGLHGIFVNETKIASQKQLIQADQDAPVVISDALKPRSSDAIRSPWSWYVFGAGKKSEQQVRRLYKDWEVVLLHVLSWLVFIALTWRVWHFCYWFYFAGGRHKLVPVHT